MIKQYSQNLPADSVVLEFNTVTRSIPAASFAEIDKLIKKSSRVICETQYPKKKKREREKNLAPILQRI